MTGPAELDKLLVGIALGETNEMALDEAGKHLRVSHESINRWRAGEWQRLNPPMRKRLKKRLAELGLYPPVAHEDSGGPVKDEKPALQVMAIIDTKRMAAEIAEELASRIPGIMRDENVLALWDEARQRKAPPSKEAKGPRGSSQQSDA
jgi:hypothetical protein